MDSFPGENARSWGALGEAAPPPEGSSVCAQQAWKKQESTRKTSISALLTMPKPLTALTAFYITGKDSRWATEVTDPSKDSSLRPGAWML